MSREVLDFPLEDVWSEDYAREIDEAVTGRGRCIGCGRFLPNRWNWNQCPDCDVRTSEDY